MDKNCIIASVVAGLAMLVVNWLVGMVPGDFFAMNFGGDWAWQSIVGSIFAGAVLAVVLGWKGAGDPAAGAKAGATIGVLMGLGSSFMGMMEGFDVMSLVGSIVAGAVVYGIAGGAVVMTNSALGSEG